MTEQYDLHSHSLASDGTLSPSDLVARAHAAGVAVLALTDHDETGGLAEADAAAGQLGIGFAPGVEISVSWGSNTIHVVALNIDAANEQLQQGLVKLRDFRDWRAREIGRRLEKRRIPGAYEGALKYARGRVLSRTHFAHFLANNGYASSVRDVFKHYLKRNKPGYVPGNWAGLEEAVGWITGAGGQAVIAHPARYELSATRRRRLLGEFVECGGEGIEVVSGSHSRDECRTTAKYARDFGLLASVGSDFHGPENPWVELGRLQPLPEGCTPIWESERWQTAMNRPLSETISAW